MNTYLKWSGITAAAGAGLSALAAAILAAWKPWAPKITMTEPGPGGWRVTENGLLANYYPAEHKAPGLLVLGGSEGGLAGADFLARPLSAHGYSVMALSYWGGPGQPRHMEKLPLEYFDTAICWLQHQDRVDADRIGLIGGSKGAEAALITASRNPSVATVVATAPSSVAWAGLDLAKPWRMAHISSTWSIGGKPVPYVPYTSASHTSLDMYQDSLTANPAAVDRASIRVEATQAPIMLVCGKADTMWPSWDMARALQQRALEAGGPTVTVLAYDNAGHGAQGPPAVPGDQRYDLLDTYGGTIDGNQAALADSWPKILEFLDTHLHG